MRERELVDWRRVRRRLGRVLVVAATVAVLGSAVTLVLTGTAAALLWTGVAALLSVVGVVLVVSATALQGMLRAGERGDRLAGGDVGLLPPQVRTGPRDGGPRRRVDR